MLSRCLMLASCLLALPAARAYFEGCDNTYTLQPGLSVFESPYYPQNYPAGTSCRYKVTAPDNHNIQMQCTISLPSNNGQCTTDNFWVDSEGDVLMRTAENFCGSGSFTRESLFTEMTFAYISTGSNSGRFRCTLNVQPQPCNCGWSVSPRISNGQQAAINEYPSMVALKDVTSTVTSFCGGVIVGPRHIVTAAHCAGLVQQPTNIVAIVGTNNLQNPSSSIYYAQYAIQQVLIHQQYQTNPNLINDIAILITATRIKWTRGVGPICLPPVGTTSSFEYDLVDVIGWGTIYFAGPASAALRKVSLMVANNGDCQTDYQGQATINANHVCTYDYAGLKQDSCQYDSGGPVIKRAARQFLLGVISFGNTCASKAYSMGVNTRVTSYLNWIRQNIGYANCQVSM
ncbi:venom serine protease [Drosophila grimshawi]|uniref:GH20821 n=1 Tax=Drosophila grimshawi TaxID=7222 RepID=B4J5V3_DROGR|nr:venom serine protease [Drosophila grimshawi]EDW00796.1 GH20821 [Drosophila grimshawi]